MKCYECEKGELKKKNIEYYQYGISLGTFEAEVCSNCNETFFTAESMEKIEKESKKKDLFGLGTKTRIGTKNK